MRSTAEVQGVVAGAGRGAKAAHHYIFASPVLDIGRDDVAAQQRLIAGNSNAGRFLAPRTALAPARGTRLHRSIGKRLQ